MYKLYSKDGYDIRCLTIFSPDDTIWHSFHKSSILKQWLMRITITCIVLFLAFTASFAAKAQNISLSEKRASLTQIFKEIKKQSGYDFVYRSDLLKTSQPVDINVKNQPLIDVLNKCFENQPFTYSIKDKTIIVKEKDKTTADIQVNSNQLNPANITGTVVDTLGQPLIGASVSLKGTNISTLTDNNGKFTLKAPSGRSLIVISYIGFATKSIQGAGDVGIIKLQLSTSNLDQVSVIAYGEESKRFSVGSVATVTADVIGNQPVKNVLLALAAQVPGLSITPTSGAPGAAVQVQIRGQNTLRNSGQPNAYDQPLFIVDGVPFAPGNQNISLLNSLGGTTGGITYSGVSPFSSINPADIASISVLKDADATSIYGTQGSNGVILITTKKGKAGKTSLDLGVNTGVNLVARPLQMMNTDQYLALRQQAAKNDGIDLTTADPSQFPDLLVFDQHKYTNWYKEFFDKTAGTTDIHASVSGGEKNTNFILSAGITNEKYNFPGNFAENRFTLHSGIHHSTADNKLNIDFGADVAYDHNNSSQSPSVTSAFLLPPNLPNLLDASGNLVWNYQGLPISQFQQYGYLKQPSDLKSYNVNTTLRISYQLAKGLNISSNFGYSRYNTTEYNGFPLGSQDPQSSPYSMAFFANNTYQSINIEPQLNYKLITGKGVLSVLLGSTYKKLLNNSTISEGDEYASDALLGSIDGAATVYTTDGSSIYRYSAGFGRIGYTYDQKYILSLTGRRDGSSNFGPGHQFGNFGSAGAGWIISEESAFKTALPAISYAKLSANYGTSGSDGIAPYLYQAFWQPADQSQSFQGIRPFNTYNLYNPNYTWGLKKSLNIAFDLGFFHDRLLLNATRYINKNVNQLSNYTLPSQTGFPSVLENINSTIQDAGWEFTLNSTNVKSKKFSWTTTFNLSWNRNKLLSFPGLATSPYAYSYTIGKSVNTINVFKYKGVNPQTGIFEFYTANGAVTSDPTFLLASQGGDLVTTVNTEPKFSGALGNNLNYENFSLSFLFQFVKKTGINYLGAIYGQYDIPGSINNVPAAALNYWKKPGDQTNIERPTTGSSTDAGKAAFDFSQSSGAYSDASYIRLKTLALSYALPPSWLSKAHVKRGNVFFQAQNLLTITGYKVGDPESAGNLLAFPLQRTLSFGLSLGF